MYHTQTAPGTLEHIDRATVGNQDIHLLRRENRDGITFAVITFNNDIGIGGKWLEPFAIFPTQKEATAHFAQLTTARTGEAHT